MLMKELLVERIRSRFDAYNEIIASSDDEALIATLDVPKHKNLAEHLWCVVGARESYARALAAGEWVGFDCSLQAFGHTDFARKLEESATSVLSVIDAVNEWDDVRTELLLTLNEHEVMHEGQIIRHLFGLESKIPTSVKWA